MRSIKTTLLTISFLLLSGCVSNQPRESVTADNFRDLAEVTDKGYLFYTAEYTGTNENCFPALPGFDCTKKNSEHYINEKLENIRYLQASFPFDEPFSGARLKSDLINLVQAEVALQLGYTYFSPVKIYELSGCFTSYSSRTTGKLHNDSYTGSSYLSENTKCSERKSTTFVVFNEPRLFKKGVFMKTQEDSRLSPFKDVYFKELMDEPFENHVFNEGSVTSYAAGNVLKEFYSAKEVAKAFQEKHGIKSVGIYPITDESIELQQQKDVMKENKLKNK